MKRKVMTTIKESHGKDRKVFYFDNDKDKPILAGGVLLYNDNSVLVQKIPKGDSFVYEDFGGKVDFEDSSAIETISREWGEEINYGIKDKTTNEYLDNKELKKILQSGMKKKIYIPTSKYFLILVELDLSKYSLDMDKIGNKEIHEDVTRTIEWITFQQFIDSHFSHQLHPRLWGKKVLEMFGYKSEPEEEVVKLMKKFAFK